jgi:hypothetical protein
MNKSELRMNSNNQNHDYLRITSNKLDLLRNYNEKSKRFGFKLGDRGYSSSAVICESELSVRVCERRGESRYQELDFLQKMERASFSSLIVWVFSKKPLYVLNDSRELVFLNRPI